MKWLKTKSGPSTYSVGIGGISITCGMSQLHILTAYAKGELVDVMWNKVDRTSSKEAAKRPKTTRSLSVQESGTANAQSFVNPFQLEHSTTE